MNNWKGWVFDKNNRPYTFSGIVILLVLLPALLILVRQTQDNRSRAASPDQLETEAGVLSSSGVTKQSDANASGGQYVLFNQSSPTPTGAPTPTLSASGTCVQTASFDATGATDVTAALTSFLTNAPAKQFVCLKPNGIYKITGQISVNGKIGLWLDGQGATIYQTVRGTDPILNLDHQGSDLVLKNVTIKGSNPTPGKWVYDYEHNHCIVLSGIVRAELDHITCLNVGGDGVYLTAGRSLNSPYPAVLGDSLRVHDSIFDGIGRMGIAWTDGFNHSEVDHNIFRNIGYYTWDIEPNGYYLHPDGTLDKNSSGGTLVGAQYGNIHDNQVGPKPYGDYPADSTQACGYNFVTTNASGGGLMADFTIQNNTNTSGEAFLLGLFGSPLRIIYSGNTPNQRTSNPSC